METTDVEAPPAATARRSPPPGGVAAIVEEIFTGASIPGADIRPKAGKMRHKGNRAEICLVPPDYKLGDKNKLLDLMTKTWKLMLPNLIVACDAGSAHPLQLGSATLASLPQFQGWLQDARRHQSTVRRSSAKGGASEPQPSGGSGPGGSGSNAPAPAAVQMRSLGGSRRRVMPEEPSREEATEEDLAMINQLIFQRMITTMAAVLDAAALSNNWILIDRTTNRSAKSATAELLLELAMEQTDQRPTVLVIDTLERLQQYTSEKAKQQLQLLASLDSASFSPGECEDLAGVSPVEWPYAPNEYLDPADFYDKPLPRAPEEAHLVDGKVSDKRKWCVHVT